ncbi:type 1 glutamine amidotransferase [Sulfuriflexus mobilis]|uniref:type 1 glutamine amidotransferase n=1 Tax=Sulfuriflexus mobilis TaxID=1811807 RepID=UPI000F82BE4B|nr:type 1 glutamine amidotransferase [Sulfuriflexus mobilis]
MKPIRFFRHIACEGPGYLGAILERLQWPYEVVCIDDGHAVPTAFDDVAGLVFMGGSMSVNDPLPWINDEIDLIQRAHQAGVPMLGVCLGSQLLTKALGGTVSKGSSGQEIGWHPLHWVNGASGIRALTDLPDEPLAFHWHGDTFSLPPGAELLLGSACYPHQAYACGKSLALQFHIEVTAEMVQEWVKLYAGDIAQGGVCNQAHAEISHNLETRIPALHRLADSLFEHWLAGLNEPPLKDR